MTIPAPGTDTRLRLLQVFASYSAAPTGGKLTVESPAGTTLLDLDIVAGGPVTLPDFGEGLPGAVNQALVVKLASGGGAVVGKLHAVTSI